MNSVLGFIIKLLTKLRGRRKGYVAILVTASVSILIMCVQYVLKYNQLSHNIKNESGAIFTTAQAALEAYIPGKTWSEQQDYVYSAAARALDDHLEHIDFTVNNVGVKKGATNDISSYSLARIYKSFSSYGIKNRASIASSPISASTLITSDPLLCLQDPLDVSFDPTNANVSYALYSTSSGTDSYNVAHYTQNNNKLTLTLDTENKCITCSFPSLKNKTVKAHPEECDVDIVIAIPTNHAACSSDNSSSGTLVAPNADSRSGTPICEVAGAFQKFLQDNFLHMVGVAVGVVPYSAKVSIPPNRTDDWTVPIPPMNAIPSDPYIKQAVAYGTDGQQGGELISAATDIQYDWGDTDGDDGDTTADQNIGYPIMRRRGDSETYRGVTVYNGNCLLSVDNPTSDDKFKFQRMNLNPCYLGHCNLLAGVCERTCPTYMANPYFITELTDDIRSVIYDLGLFRPINDADNKSNFLFLPLSWAANLLSSWTSHPAAAASASSKLAHPARTAKKQAVIIVVNAPDNFAPQELTYLGFNNDNSEIPMYESDVINFGNNYGAPTNSATTSPVKSSKGTLVFTTTSGTVAYNADSEYYETNGTAAVTGKLTFPQKNLVKVVVEPRSEGSWKTLGSNKASDVAPGYYEEICSIGSKLYSINQRSGQLVTLDTGVNAPTWTAVGNKADDVVPSIIWCGICSIGAEIFTICNGNGNVDNNGQLLVLDTSTSSPAWEIISLNNISDVVERNDGSYISICVVDETNSLYAINKSGELFEFNFFSNEWAMIANANDAVPENIGWAKICSMGNIMGDIIFSIDFGGKLAMRQTSSNRPGLIPMYSVAANGYFNGICSIGSKLYALEASGGQLFTLDTSVSSSAWKAIGSNKAGDVASGVWLCICSIGDKLYSINSSSGQLVEILPIDPISIQFTNITASTTGGTTTSEQTITDRREFYIEPSQISNTKDANGNYFITFNMENIRLISAEITNRPYTTVTPTVTLSGADALGKTNQTATITTNVKRPLTIKARTPLLGTVTFYSDNNIQDHVGTHNLTETRTFTFSGPTKTMWNWNHNSVSLYGNAATGGVNFGHNLSIYKMKYSLTNAEITSATLSNQILRCYAHYGINSPNGTFKSLILNNSGHVCDVKNLTSEQYTDPCICGDYGNYGGSADKWHWNENNPGQIGAYNFHPSCYGVQKVKFLMTAAGITEYMGGEKNLTMYTADGWSSIGEILSGNKYNVFDLSNKTSSYADRVQVFTGRFSYKSSETYDVSGTSIVLCDTIVSSDCSNGDNEVIIKTCDNEHGNKLRLTSSCSCTKKSCIVSDEINYEGEPATGWQIKHIDYNSSLQAFKATFERYSRTCTKLYDKSGALISNDCPSDATLNSTNKSPYRYQLNNFFFINTENKTYASSYTKDDIIANKGIGTLNDKGDDATWLCFCGDGQLAVTVQPNITSGNIAYKNASDNDNSISVTNENYQTFTISPETHKYELQSDGTYKINLTLTNVKISDPQMVNSDVVFEYSKPSLPNCSRVVDFSKNYITSSTSADSYYDLMNYNMMYYDDVAGYWKTDTGRLVAGMTSYGNPYCEFRTNQIAGDFFCILEDIGTIAPQLRLFDQSGADTYLDLKCKIYNFTGTHRIFQNYSNIRNSDIASFDFTNAASGGNAQFIFGGFTIPANYALVNNGRQVLTTTGDISPAYTEPNQALASAATDAYDELKELSTGKAKPRTYIIKYRMGSTATSLDGLAQCLNATDAGCAKIYNATSKDDLVNKLHEIAQDIKQFAGVKESRVEE
ncbi:MAG: hypothetical protein LBL99_01635 [Holosporaceae bacterium]|jgi:hypothetical protein|nr:hypothetical protein [Holosporaceae bacterium]